MVEFSVKNATILVITKILKFVKIIIRGGGKLKILNLKKIQLRSYKVHKKPFNFYSKNFLISLTILTIFSQNQIDRFSL